jgi:hypothetical protein
MTLNTKKYTYATDIATILTTATAQPQITTDNNSEFIIQEERAVIMLPVTGINAATGTIMMQVNLSGGEVLSNVAINLLSYAQVIPSLAANNFPIPGYPIRYMEGIKLGARSQLTHTIVNNTNGTILVQILYIGIKIPIVSQ